MKPFMQSITPLDRAMVSCKIARYALFILLSWTIFNSLLVADIINLICLGSWHSALEDFLDIYCLRKLTDIILRDLEPYSPPIDWFSYIAWCIILLIFIGGPVWLWWRRQTIFRAFILAMAGVIVLAVEFDCADSFSLEDPWAVYKCALGVPVFYALLGIFNYIRKKYRAGFRISHILAVRLPPVRAIARAAAFCVATWTIYNSYLFFWEIYLFIIGFSDNHFWGEAWHDFLWVYCLGKVIDYIGNFPDSFNVNDEWQYFAQMRVIIFLNYEITIIYSALRVWCKKRTLIHAFFLAAAGTFTGPLFFENFLFHSVPLFCCYAATIFSYFTLVLLNEQRKKKCPNLNFSKYLLWRLHLADGVMHCR